MGLYPYTIYANFSLEPGEELQWYFNEIPLHSSNPYYFMEADGLNAVLYLSKPSFFSLFGRYRLAILGTGISDYIDFLKGNIRGSNHLKSAAFIPVLFIP